MRVRCLAKRRRSRLPASIQEELIKQFVAGATARAAADLAGVNRYTAIFYFLRLREPIAAKLAEQKPSLSAEIEFDEETMASARQIHTQIDKTWAAIP